MKKICKNLFRRGDFTPFMRKSFQIWDHFFPLLFPKDSENLKSLDIGLREVGEKRPLNGVRNTDTKKFLLSKAKFTQKQTFFLRSDFTPYISKGFQIWDHFFPLLFPKDSESKTFFDAAILHPLWAKFLKSETTSFHYFYPRILKIKKKIWTLDFGK